MKRRLLNLGPDMSVQTDYATVRYYIVYSRGRSSYTCDQKEVRRLLKLPPKTPSRDTLDAWLAEVAAYDAEKRKPLKVVEGISDEIKATGFGPEAHLDESDPNFETRMVV